MVCPLSSKQALCVNPKCVGWCVQIVVNRINIFATPAKSLRGGRNVHVDSSGEAPD
jgi:hypothetical protein